MERQLVKFSKTWPPYNAGDVAAFSPERAAWLERYEYGKIYTRPAPGTCQACGQEIVIKRKPGRPPKQMVAK